jgi:hypothetical protein
MKYIKLFENFDPYDFGRIGGDLESRYNDIRKMAVEMSDDAINMIKNEFSDEYYASAQTILCYGGEKTGAIVATSTKPRIMNNALIISLPDYIYCVVFTEKEESIRGVSQKITKIFSCDDIEMTLECLRTNLWKINK